MSRIISHLIYANFNTVGEFISNKDINLSTISNDTCWFWHKAVCIYVKIFFPFLGVAVRLELCNTELLLMLFPCLVLYFQCNVYKHLWNAVHFGFKLLIIHFGILRFEFGAYGILEIGSEFLVIA